MQEYSIKLPLIIHSEQILHSPCYIM